MAKGFGGFRVWGWGPCLDRWRRIRWHINSDGNNSRNDKDDDKTENRFKSNGTNDKDKYKNINISNNFNQGNNTGNN